jgi:hypothetical protein
MRLGISYHGPRQLEHVSHDLEGLAREGTAVAVLCVTEEALAYRFRGVADAVAAARAAGLETLVDLWGGLGILGGEAVSFAIARDPWIRQRLSDGTLVPAACPNNPRTGEWMDRWLDVVAATGANGILWDVPHLWMPGSDPWTPSARGAWSCACDVCVDAWAGHRHGAPDGPMPSRLTPDLMQFRRRSLTGLLGAAFAQAHASGLSNVITVLPADDGEPEALPFDDLASLPFVGGLGTEPYWIAHGRTVRPYVRRWSGRVVQAAGAHHARSHVWVSLRGIPRGSAVDLEVAVADAASEGIDDLFVSVDPTPVRDDPDLLPEWEAWRIVSDAVRGTQASPVAEG